MDHEVLLDTFADARRTWDDLVALQPDVKAGGGALKTADLVELERRVEAHREALDLLADALETEPNSGDEQNESSDAAQKEARSRYPDRSMPSSRKVAGAFGKKKG